MAKSPRTLLFHTFAVVCISVFTVSNSYLYNIWIRNGVITIDWNVCSCKDLAIILHNCHDHDLIGNLWAWLWQFVNELVLFLIAYLIIENQHNSISNLYHNCMQRWNVGVYHLFPSNHLFFMENFPKIS